MDRPAPRPPSRQPRALARSGAAAGPRSDPPEQGSAETPRPRKTSDRQRLAREVDRLEAELAGLRARMAELEQHADHDPLTGLLNRRAFEREAERAVAHVARYGGRLVLLYLDLDAFKPINDRYGHAAGDAVLVAVARALRIAVRTSDLVARLGGDEFAMLLWNLSDDDAHAKAIVLEEVIARLDVVWEGVPIAVRGSAGAAAIPQVGDVAVALSAADAAMYTRKAAAYRARAETLTG